MKCQNVEKRTWISEAIQKGRLSNNDIATRVPYRSLFSEAIHCLKKCPAWKSQICMALSEMLPVITLALAATITLNKISSPVFGNAKYRRWIMGKPKLCALHISGKK